MTKDYDSHVFTWGEYKNIKGDPEMTDDEIGNARHIEGTVDPVHYHFTIEPFDYIHDNDMGFAEGNVIKYITRWKYKGGIEDLYKAKQYINMLIEKELEDDPK
tara:strand:- start:88 stop:396 length:309 start_codon:yes stop_codon:yes gene_type:complete